MQALQAQGVRSIDVGCMQINLRHHPNAFANLDEAFDPAANARYAARFLNNLQATRNDWMRSASHYHSQTPELADAYRARIAAALEAEQAVPPPARHDAGRACRAAPPGARLPRLLHPPSPAEAAGSCCPTAWSAPRWRRRRRTAAVAGGGLDAYRSMPIPVAGPRPGAGGAGHGRARADLRGVRLAALRGGVGRCQRIGQEYISPPSVQSRFSPRSRPIGVFGPRVRSNSSP